MNNLDLYNRYAQPPESALKAFNNGKFSGTDINPMWRIKALTEAFGPCGLGWYTDVVRMWREDTDDGNATVYCHLNLYIKQGEEWSKPISGVGGNTLMRKTKTGTSTTDEAYKMAFTDAMGIACKALGIGADIWWKEARSKYTANDQGAKNELEEDPAPPADVCDECGNVVTDYIATSGVTKAAIIASNSRKMYGRCLCGRCAVKAAKSA